MATPSYSDLGKDAEDIFSEGYHFGLVNLDLKTQPGSDVEFSIGGTCNQETGKIFGTLETKYILKEYGLTFTEKLNTDNTVVSELSLEDQLLEGLKLGAELYSSPQTGYEDVSFTSSFSSDVVSLDCSLDLNAEGPLISAAAVVGYEGFLAGYHTAFDVNSSKVICNNFALGFTTDDFTIHTNIDNGQDFGGSIYQKISNQLHTGISLAWTSDGSNTKFGIGAKYDLNENASIRAKVNNERQVGLGYQQRLREGATLTLSALIDGKNFNNGGHKVGLAFEMEF